MNTINRIAFSIVPSIALVFGMAACQKQTVVPVAQSESVAAIATTVSAPGAPKALTDSAENAEVTYDAVKVGNWAEAIARVGLLQESTAAYPDLATPAATLAIHVRAHDRLEAMTVANEITRQANELLRTYPAATPVDVAMLDYEGRQLEIAAGRNSLPVLKDTTKQIRQTWDEVRPQVINHGGTAESSAFDTLVAQLEQAKSTAEYQRIAASILNDVDLLEAVFTKTPQPAA
jgi:hypothetical protein